MVFYVEIRRSLSTTSSILAQLNQSAISFERDEITMDNNVQLRKCYYCFKSIESLEESLRCHACQIWFHHQCFLLSKQNEWMSLSKHTIHIERLAKDDKYCYACFSTFCSIMTTFDPDEQTLYYGTYPTREILVYVMSNSIENAMNQETVLKFCQGKSLQECDKLLFEINKKYLKNKFEKLKNKELVEALKFDHYSDSVRLIIDNRKDLVSDIDWQLIYRRYEGESYLTVEQLFHDVRTMVWKFFSNNNKCLQAKSFMMEVFQNLQTLRECSDCYVEDNNLHKNVETFFTRHCSLPHRLVWAKRLIKFTRNGGSNGNSLSGLGLETGSDDDSSNSNPNNKIEIYWPAKVFPCVRLASPDMPQYANTVRVRYFGKTRFSRNKLRLASIENRLPPDELLIYSINSPEDSPHDTSIEKQYQTAIQQAALYGGKNYLEWWVNNDFRHPSNPIPYDEKIHTAYLPHSEKNKENWRKYEGVIENNNSMNSAQNQGPVPKKIKTLNFTSNRRQNQSIYYTNKPSTSRSSLDENLISLGPKQWVTDRVINEFIIRKIFETNRERDVLFIDSSCWESIFFLFEDQSLIECAIHQLVRNFHSDKKLALVNIINMEKTKAGIEGKHYILGMIDLVNHRIYICDSMNDFLVANNTCNFRRLDYLARVLSYLRHREDFQSVFTFYLFTDTSFQINYYDCGIHSSMNAYSILQKQPFEKKIDMNHRNMIRDFLERSEQKFETLMEQLETIKEHSVIQAKTSEIMEAVSVEHSQLRSIEPAFVCLTDLLVDDMIP